MGVRRFGRGRAADHIDGGRAGLSRRSVMAGAGLASAAWTAGMVAPGAADARTAAARGDGTATPDGGRHPDTSPISTSIGSAPVSGYVYRSVDMYEFKPFNPAAQATWGGFGLYSAGTASAMRASLEIPPGALLRDVEYYLYNNSGASFYPDVFLYVPGQGTIFSVGASLPVPSGTVISATHATVTQQGPYPLGSKLLVSCATPITGKIQVNGARLGFTQGQGELGLFHDAVRAFDSRAGSGKKLTAFAVHTVTLPSSAVPSGASALILNVTAVNAAGAGFLKVFSADQPAPRYAATYFTTSPTSVQITCRVSAGRQIRLAATQALHVAIDVIGVVA